MSLSRNERRWMLPAQGASWLIVPSVEAETEKAGSNRVPDVFVTTALDRWLVTPAARTLYAMYEALGGSPPLGLSGLERGRYEQRLKQRLSEAFAHGELVALEVERPVLVPRPWPEPPRPEAEEAPPAEMTWLAIELKDEEGKPVPYARYVVTLPDGGTREGTLNKNGYARVDGVNPGQCQVSFPELDGQSWR
ncbi:carboxypeptidase-like regulatory domain-containing protein [Myxococcus sp. RHSTA-1-4]|uniref:carboxypeptidase-like regulatory domain-containing protein n=1 Tax=Myxococcus sp. RHSTA-1-4 TaxID=2874601 RepID=UPI001CBE03E6|nr:carboxypeptidase-like regulatory domain-containing protein [Myxococcus sp. RHSTA-1-4]MBZ4420680.1 carboxypeptidase regulatory-like domain-containing protein [Myxococcus sp. RHSTA-1-4]